MQGAAFNSAYILLKDKENAEKTTRVLGVPVPRQWHTSACRVLKGELVAPIPPGDRVQRNDGQVVHNYRTLTKDTPATFYHDEDELDLSPLSPNDYDVLVGIRSEFSRYQFFIERLDWATKLKKGRKVLVELPLPGEAPKASAVIRYVGPVQTLPGVTFGVEIKDKNYFGWGTSNGLFQDEQYFRCKKDCGLFVSAEKIFPVTPLPAGSHEPALKHEGKRSPHTRLSFDNHSGFQYKIGDRVVVFTKKGDPVHGTVKWVGIYSFTVSKKTYSHKSVGIEVDVKLKTNEVEGFPIKSGFFVPARDRSAVFLTEDEVLPEAQFAEGKASVQSSDVGSKERELLREAMHDNPEVVTESPRQLANPPPHPGQHRAYVDPHQPTPVLDVGSPVELVQDPSHHGVVRWLGILPDIRGLVAGVELDGPMQGCGDGEWKGHRFFTCLPGRGFFCLITSLRPDPRIPQIPEYAQCGGSQNVSLQIQKYQESRGLPIERAVGEAGLLIADLQETGRTLGTGSYGEVVEVQVRGRRCAAKKLHGVFTMQDVPPKEKLAMTERFETECRRVLYLSHPNIIEMIGIHFDQTSRLPTLVMELMDTSLCKYLENNSKSSVPLSTKYTILHDVASGLLYLHSLPPPLGPIVHRDLTANNILLGLGRGVVAKIADLGQAKIDSKYATRQQQLSQVPGNEYHMPPEAWLDNPVYNASLDVFSFGVVILHTLSHEWPKPLGRLKSAMEVCPEVERRKPYLDKISGSPLKPLVEQCLSQLTKDRPSTNDVFNTLKLCIAQMVCSNLLKATSLPCGGDIIELIHRLAGSTKGASNVAPQGHQTDYIIHSQPATPTVAAASAHQPQVSSAVSQVSGPPNPGAAGRPIPVPRKPRSNASKPADRGDKKKQNVHWLNMEGSQPSPGSQDSLIATLPPPITDFTTPLEDTPSFESGIKILGFPNPTGGGGYDSFSFPRDSGPQGLGDSQPPLLLEQTSASSSAMSQGTTASSSESLDLYGSGTGLQQRGRQFSSQTKLDRVEGDRPHQERSQPPLRHIQSGSNLPAMEGRSFQRDPIQKLEKPQPAPRRSRSPSPTGSGEPSPSASPKLAPHHRSTHEPWTPTGQNRPFPPPPDASPKWRTLPRQAQSVEVEPQSNKVMPRFSSGSDLLRDKTARKHLEFKPPAARREFEPDTPVVGLLPAHLKKLHSQSAASTQPMKPQIPPGGSEPQPHQPHTHPQNNCSEIVKEKELQEQLQQEQQERRKREQELQQEQQQRIELERRLEQLEQQQQQEKESEILARDITLQQEQQQRMELQRQLQQQQQEKEETQKRLRDLQLQLEQQQQKEVCFKPPFLSEQQKSVVVSPTNAQATASLPKPDESQLKFGGEGAQALRAQQYSREAAGQRSSGEGKLRERANADASRYRPKQTSTDKPTHKPPEQETSFTDPLTQDSGSVGTLDVTTHIDLEDTWVCGYCTNLNSDSLPNCEVYERPDPRPRTWVCHRCQNHNPCSLSQCKTCRRPQETVLTDY